MVTWKQRFGFVALFCNVFNVLTFDCNSKDEILQVHLVPHTHDDVGWLKTVDEYYYGANNTIQDAGVQYILDTVVTELQKNPNRTFIYVEIAFFERWWDEQDDRTKDIVKNLVKNKQLEFINGGWCMNDEASTHYNAIIDQMTLGLKFIDKYFGTDARPSIAWHIDPFGHSAEQASLFSLMSFDGFFFGRIDEQDKQKRKKEKRMEMIWRGSRNYEQLSQIFTGVLYNGYGPPAGFCYDDYCADPPIQDNPHLYDMNVKERVDSFVAETCEQAQHYKTNNIILTMGSDFQYANALKWYKNLDKLIRYVNKDGRVNVFYSTPSRYLKAVHDSEKKWEVKTDDFFPYAHCDHCYWTGYFTSRPALKGYVRETNNILQACKQIETMREKIITGSPTTKLLKKAMGVAQHHDAVSGTEKQHVANDYAKRLYIGREECKSLMSSFIEKKIEQNNNATLKFTYCDFLNISSCGITETQKSFAVNIYNTIARATPSFIRVPVSSQSYTVYGPDGKIVPSQIVTVSNETAKLRKSGSAPYELVFQVLAPPMGFSTYLVQKKQGLSKYKRSSSTYSENVKMTKDNNIIENEFLKLEFSPDTGHLVRMSRKDQELSIDVEQQFFWYNGSVGNDVSRQTSGAYIFRPNKTKPYVMCNLNKAKVTIVQGPLVQEIRQSFGPIVSQVIRLYKGEIYAEFEHTVGPIPIEDGLGKEIITRFDTNIKSDGKFYTDANGREMKERIRNHRDTWSLKVTEPVSGNYYPINSRIFIKDSQSQLTVMSDRSQGGASINNGQIEVMLHRRLLVDDFLGVGEPLNETDGDGVGLVTRGKHRVLLTKPEEAALLHRRQGELMMMEPILSFSKNPYTVEQWQESFQSTYSGMVGILPDNVHLLTVEREEDGQILLRLENYFEESEMNETATVNLKGLFKDFEIVSVVEMNLSANQFIKDKKMIDWNTTGTQFHSDQTKTQPRDDMIVDLKPMEIRTFIAKLQSTKGNPTMEFHEIRDKPAPMIL